MAGPHGPEERGAAGRHFTVDDVSELLGSRTGRLPSSGAPHDEIYTQQNRDYPDDTDICFARGNADMRVRLTPADRPKLFAAVGGLAPKLADLRERAKRVPASGQVYLWAAKLVNEAHAAGYALCDEDYRVTGEDGQQVRDYLIGLKEDGTDRGHLDAEALERVIAMLEEK